MKKSWKSTINHGTISTLRLSYRSRDRSQLGKIARGENFLVRGLGITSVHAEHDALDEFKKLLELYGIRLPKNRKKIIVDIVSFRSSKTGVMGNAHPCKNCVMRMKKAEEKLGIVIRFVYYSTGNGFIKVRFNQLIDSPLTHHSSGTRHMNNLRKKNKHRN